MELLVTFHPLGRGIQEPFTIAFSPQHQGNSPLALWNAQNTLEEMAKPHPVCSDLSYQLKLTFPKEKENTPHLTGILVYVNEQEQPCSWDRQNNAIHFPQIYGADNCIFLDCFGFVDLRLQLHFADNTQEILACPPLPVLVREDTVSKSVQAMADYLFQRQEERLYRGKFREKDYTGNSYREQHSLESRILLAEEILTAYETQVHYFQSNCRFKMAQVDVVDRMEKLQQVTPRTMAFTAQHPEYLKKVSGTTGISWGNRVFLPEKTLVTQNVYSKDIYENKVVVSFLHRMQTSLQELALEMNALCQAYQGEELPEYDLQEEDSHHLGAYIASHHCILEKMTHVLEESQQKIFHLQRRFRTMTLQYHKILDFPLEYWDNLESTPKPTPILLSVPQYHTIFLRMHQWFHQGSYDFGKENAMLSVLNISDLYEQYLLGKFVEYFQAEGWTDGKFYHLIYGRASQEPSIESLGLPPNTFQFHKGKEKVTLFYQANIYDSDKNYWNETVGLYRNNNNSLHQSRGELAKGSYYQPDFVFKIESPKGTRYVIADAKFSTLYRVKQHYLLPLLYKYLFSISPVNPEDTVAGLAVFYGKCVDESPQESAYNKQISPIRPFTELFPMVEGVKTPEQYAFLSKMLEF